MRPPTSTLCMLTAALLLGASGPARAGADLTVAGELKQWHKVTVDLQGPFAVTWFNPRSGGALTRGEVKRVTGGGVADLGAAPDGEDWLAVVRRGR